MDTYLQGFSVNQMCYVLSSAMAQTFAHCVEYVFPKALNNVNIMGLGQPDSVIIAGSRN